MPLKMHFALIAAILSVTSSLAYSQTSLPFPPTRPVLLELFTSQSCSSCPPADAYVGTLKDRSDVLPLTFHVDYWNDLGWVDQLSSPAYTSRQQSYASSIHSSVYTPQIVIDGTEDAVGSNRGKVEAAVRRAEVHPLTVPVSITKGRGGVDISVPAAPASQDIRLPAKLLLITFDPSVTTAIHGGENSGRTISYFNVVRSMREIGSWSSGAMQLSEPLHGDESGSRVALIIQDHSGRIFGVAATP